LFVAEGSPPYILAAGRDPGSTTKRSNAGALARINETNLVGTAVIGAAQELGGAQQTVAPIVLPWRAILLWTLLICGVGGAVWMVVRLLRQMREL
jgi:hypothetical protein